MRLAADLQQLINSLPPLYTRLESEAGVLINTQLVDLSLTSRGQESRLFAQWVGTRQGPVLDHFCFRLLLLEVRLDCTLLVGLY